MACMIWLLRIVGALTAPTSMALTRRWRSRPQHHNRTSTAVQQTVGSDHLGLRLFLGQWLSDVAGSLYLRDWLVFRFLPGLKAEFPEIEIGSPRYIRNC